MTLIICISVHHGNTEKIARAMVDVLDAELLKPHEVDVGALSGYDLIGFGSGIYCARHHRALLDIAAKMPVMKDKKAFIFSTRGIGSVRFYHRLLRKELLVKEFNVVGEFSCRGFDTVGPFKLIGGVNKGRPDERDLENARKFARGIGMFCKRI